MITGKAKVAGVMGDPVAHSRSPVLHGGWLSRYGIDGAYVPLKVSTQNFESALRTLPRIGFVGVNVTLPHKEKAYKLSDVLTPRAERAGAVNTVVFQEDGSILGDNTDGFGFLENLRWRCPLFSAGTSRAVVLGAGGAARAVAAALLDAGCPHLTLVNRNIGRAETLAYALDGPIEVRSWAEVAGSLESAGLLVNTTSLGMEGQPPLELDLDPLPRDAVVTDIVYAPLETDLLEAARERGNPVVDGFGMLLHQARPGFKAWFGIDPVVDDDLWTRMKPG
ncbi:shikimate dehydrogenase [Phaeovibrio sulfidiphilus]|uniref:Shikimate dehydrogenase (NADP(+)) n=1 Tax=Phaeovibrio sulfidiphilus TaxID=1220600 RepID=A0A8J6YNH9_9PROT|nr:shikimate dehydrogenase [Phaeovibrio sulfidiphilus]MBE1236596.1 shikimate dehydrogenase [Phaeovibrio sulfidiphilus]